MLKIFLVGLAMVGAFVVMCLYVPSLWAHGVSASGYYFPFAVLGVGIIGILAWRAIR